MYAERKAYYKAYYEANKEKIKARKKAHYKANKEKIKARDKAWREANKEKKTANNKAYYIANKKKISAWHKAYYEANKEKIKAYNKSYYEANKEKIKPKYKAYYEANKEKRKAYELKFNYNITLKKRDLMLKKQNNKCKICNTKFSKVTPNIDHCHITNKVRGILCNMCNMGLGLFKDNTENLTNAITYLKEAETLPEEFK